jgi:uncharacterized protein (DUF305 family)
MRRLALVSLFVSAFGAASSAPAAPMEQSPPPNEDVEAAPAQLVVDGLYSDARFLDMMAAHHAVAVDMAKLEIQLGKRPELVQLARAIVAAQTREIDQMRDMKRRLYGDAHVTRKMNPQQMQNAGMIDPDRLPDQPDIDLAFIDSMIPHHGSALVMASVARLRSNDESIVKMARGIVDAQSREIGEMNSWRNQWFEGAP